MNPFQKRLELAQSRLDKILAQQARLETNAIPGTFITGSSGVPASRHRKLSFQLDRTIELAKKRIAAQRDVDWFTCSVELFDAGKINAQGRSITPTFPKKKVRNEPRLFIGVYPTGWVFADRWVEVNNDYRDLAIIFFSNVQLNWRAKRMNSQLREEIIAFHNNKLSQIGERYTISGSGQYITIGYNLL